MPKIINLIPKVKCSLSVTDYRLISCCNVIYGMFCAFNPKRGGGVRQGDPFSPEFQFQPIRKAVKLNHLRFADDLLIARVSSNVYT